MVFENVNVIQEGEAAIFYKFSRQINGYMIAALLIGPSMQAKLDFAKVWKYFVNAVVQADDIYCSVIAGTENTMFNSYLDYYDTINGLKIYKVDNLIRDQYSSYSKARLTKPISE